MLKRVLLLEAPFVAPAMPCRSRYSRCGNRPSVSNYYGHFDAGILDRQQYRPMLTYLSIAERFADRGLVAPAEQALDRFVTVATGVDDEEARNELVSSAESLRELLREGA